MQYSFTEKEEFIRELVTEHVQIENMKEEYQEKLLKQNKKSIVEQQDKLASTISKLVVKYKQNEGVECIQLVVNCDVHFENDNRYYLWVVCDSSVLDAIDKERKVDNARYSRKDYRDRFGGELYIVIFPSDIYDVEPVGIIDVPKYTEWTDEMIKSHDLLINKILYDKTGKYLQMKEVANKPYNEKTKAKKRKN